MKDVNVLKAELQKEEELFNYLEGEFTSLTADESKLIKDLLKRDMADLQTQLKKEDHITILGLINAARTGVKEYLDEKRNAREFLAQAANTYGIAVDDNIFSVIYENLLKATKQVNNMMAKVLNVIKKPFEQIKSKVQSLDRFINDARIKIHDAFIKLRIACLDLTVNSLESFKKPFVTERDFFQKGVDKLEDKNNNLAMEITDTNDRINFINSVKTNSRAGLDRLLVNAQLLENKAHRYILNEQNKAVDKGIAYISNIRDTENMFVEKFDAKIVSLMNKKDSLMAQLSAPESDKSKADTFEYKDLG